MNLNAAPLFLIQVPHDRRSNRLHICHHRRSQRDSERGAECASGSAMNAMQGVYVSAVLLTYSMVDAIVNLLEGLIWN